MKHARRQQGKGAFDLIEEAAQLLRTAPAAALALYYLGAIPFVLGLLFFWADMSRSPFANQHLADASLAMSILFLWMKFWQALFARRVRAQVAAAVPPALNFRRGARIFIAQTVLQPFGLFLIPLSLVPALPFAWVYAFYQNVTALADGGKSTPELFKKSCRQAALWPMQNNLALAILVGFAFYVFINWATVCLVLPRLLKMLFGVQSVFSQSPWSMLNTTFFAAMFGLTYLCVDPILKTFYALRCFYGESLQSGEDLAAELKPFVSGVQKIATVILIFSAIFWSPPAKAAGPQPPVSPHKVSAQNALQISTTDLNRAINETIHESKYTWRMPREKVGDADAGNGMVARFFDKVGAMLRKWTRAVLHWLDEWLKKLSRNWHPASVGTKSAGYGWIVSVQLLLWSLIAVALTALAIFLYRVWRDRQKSRTAIAGEAILLVPDITDENVGADQLPEDGWTKLARELLERGEFRLAMRAFYLASLSHLAARNLISLARFKSNRDYERELRRRGHSFPELLSVFNDNISIFEGIWYGLHEVNPGLVNQFASNVERIKSAG
jgi:hypothetical protein